MIRVRLLLLFCVVVWGWTFVATKICLVFLDPLALVGLRFLIGLPILAAIVLLKRSRAARRPRSAATQSDASGTRLSGFSARTEDGPRFFAFAPADLPALALGAGIITAHFLIQATALRYTSAMHTGWIIAVSPLAIAVLARLLLGEQGGRRLWIGIALATAGIVLLVSKGQIASLGWLANPGDWLVLLSALTWAAYTIATRNLSRSRDPLVVTLAVYAPLTAIGAAHLALPPASSGPHTAPLTALPASALLSLLFLGVLGTAAQWFWQVGIARLGAARAGVFLYLEPLATTALAVPLLGESYGIMTALGGALILGGVWWAERPAAGG